MKAKAKFYMFGGWHEFTVDTDNCDHNDTHFSSWTVSEDGHVFEIDILKDEDGHYMMGGCVFGYETQEDYDNGESNSQTYIDYYTA